MIAASFWNTRLVPKREEQQPITNDQSGISAPCPALSPVLLACALVSLLLAAAAAAASPVRGLRRGAWKMGAITMSGVRGVHGMYVVCAFAIFAQVYIPKVGATAEMCEPCESCAPCVDCYPGGMCDDCAEVCFPPFSYEGSGLSKNHCVLSLCTSCCCMRCLIQLLSSSDGARPGGTTRSVRGNSFRVSKRKNIFPNLI